MLITIIKLHSRMNTAAFLLPFLLLLASPATSPAGAQPSPPNQYPYARFSPSMAIIIVVLIAALFFMGFFSIYIRHCSDSSIGAGSVRRALSLRSRRAAAARGLDASVIESFPTFSYAEVKDHQIGKGSLECAVCLNEFEDDETLRLLPQCDHVFHPECIDAWLGSHVTCPVCRANLSPSPPADDQLPESSPLPETDPAASGEVVVQVDEDQHQSESQPPPAAAGRSWSIRIPKVAVFGGAEKFRSHSTGHSMVYPVENLERFTLRLPDQVRKDVMNRASLNRTASLAAAAASLPRQGSSSRARFYRRIEREGRSSDRWGFSMRAMSMRSPKAAVEGGGGESGSGRIPVKMPSFKCLEPKASDDEAGLFSRDQSASHAV